MEEPGARCELDRYAERYLEQGRNAKVKGARAVIAGPWPGDVQAREPMDFSPGGFRNATATQFKPAYSRPMVMGTRCHQLAMFVVYESPLQMVCVDPAAYRDQPGLDFIRADPTAWDEPRVVDAEIGDYLVIARRRADEWYLGAMADLTARELPIPMSFLGPGEYRAQMFADGEDADTQPTSVIISQEAVSAHSVLRVRLPPGRRFGCPFSPVRRVEPLWSRTRRLRTNDLKNCSGILRSNPSMFAHRDHRLIPICLPVSSARRPNGRTFASPYLPHP